MEGHIQHNRQWYNPNGTRANVALKCKCCGNTGQYTQKVADRGICPVCMGSIDRAIKATGSIFKKCKCCGVGFNSVIIKYIEGLPYYGVCSKECQEKNHRNIGHSCYARRHASKKSVYHEKINRADVFSRDKYKCKTCGVKVNDKTARLDHIMPISKGGPHTLCNLQTLCEPCNLRKADKIPIGITLTMFAIAPHNGVVKDIDKTHKVCTACKKELPVDKFRWKDYRKHYSATCIECSLRLARESHARRIKTDQSYVISTRQRYERHRDKIATQIRPSNEI